MDATYPTSTTTRASAVPRMPIAFEVWQSHGGSEPPISDK
jgi:hypothetical protein